MTPWSTISGWFSVDSARFAMTPVAWWQTSTSGDCMYSHSSGSTFSRTITTLPCTLSEMLRKAAAISRFTSTSSVRPRPSSTGTPRRSTNWLRNLADSQRWRVASVACRFVSLSTSESSCTSERAMPRRSQVGWLLGLDAMLLSAKATARFVRRSADLAQSMRMDTAPTSKSSWWLSRDTARLPRPSTP